MQAAQAMSPWTFDDHPLLSERFDSRTLRNMELALDLACQRLALNEQSHETRSLIARKIVESVLAGECSVDAMAQAAEAAVDNPSSMVGGSR